LFLPLIYARTLLGIDVLEHNDFKDLEGRNVALITNQTGVNAQGVSTVDLLFKNKKCKLVRILTPEHGFRGVVGHGEKVADSVDPRTGIPVMSLYGEMRDSKHFLHTLNSLL
jgi:uncharacterized protein YbbC (DUF1343 family)